MDFDFYIASYNTFGPSMPSSHEMRYKPFLGSMNRKTQKMRCKDEVESGKYEWEWYNCPSRRSCSSTFFPRVTHLLGNHVNH
jgi:hypothetical protein